MISTGRLPNRAVKLSPSSLNARMLKEAPVPVPGFMSPNKNGLGAPGDDRSMPSSRSIVPSASTCNGLDPRVSTMAATFWSPSASRSNPSLVRSRVRGSSVATASKSRRRPNLRSPVPTSKLISAVRTAPESGAESWALRACSDTGRKSSGSAFSSLTLSLNRSPKANSSPMLVDRPGKRSASADCVCKATR